MFHMNFIRSYFFFCRTKLHYQSNMAVGRNDILKLSTDLLNCVRENDIIGARCIVSYISEKKDRKLIASKKDNCNAPLFEAAVRGNAEMVSFLVEECSADLEERAEYIGFHFIDELMTPLLCAAISKKLEVARCLIDLGADINAVSSCGSTPVLFACDQPNTEVAEYLIKHGADINKPNKSGETCLMKAVKFKALCQLLIDNGADVTAQDENGDLALHYAIKREQPDTVKLLIDHGADPYVKNKSGDDAFQAASLRGRELILNKLLTKIKPPIQRWIESYQLFGGYYIDFGDDTDKALQFWREAVDIQRKNLCVEIIPSKPNSVYLFVQEVNTVEELEALARNRESVNMYALMIRERILGPYHNETIRGLLNRGRSYKRNGEIRRCMDIWKHALQLQSTHVGQLTDQYCRNFILLCNLFRDLYKEVRQSDGGVDQHILINDTLEVLEMVTMKLEFTAGNKPIGKKFKTDFVLSDFMDEILIIMRLIVEQDTHAYKECSFKNIVHRLVRCQPKNWVGRTFLHCSILPITYLNYNIYGGFIPQFEHAVVELLLECGANVNAVDDDHNTALHLCSKAIRNSGTQKHHDLMKGIAELLLKNGAHVDMVNLSGNSAAEILTSSLIGWNVLDFVSLKCLAARVVMECNIPYAGHIPASLESFVQIHGTPNEDDSDDIRMIEG